MKVLVHKPGVADTEGCVKRLNLLAPRFHRELHRAIPRKRLPRLDFAWDASIDAGDHILSLLRAIEEEK